MIPFIKFNNGDLRFNIQKIQYFDAPITVAKAFDNNLDYPFAIDVEDSSYFYANIEERNEDFEKLNSIMPQFSFVESPNKNKKWKQLNSI